MVLLIFQDGTGEIQNTDKLELKVATLVEQQVKTIFVAKKLSDIKTFIKVTKESE